MTQIVSQRRTREKQEEKKENKDEGDEDAEEETLERIALKNPSREEEEKSVQYKTGLSEFFKPNPDIYKIGTPEAYDTLSSIRNKLADNKTLSYDENKLFYAMKDTIENVDTNRLQTADEVLDNIIASKYLLKQIDNYKKKAPETAYKG